MPGPHPARLHIASYNIYKARYLDRAGPRGGTLRDDLASLADVRAADILLFQEAIVVPPAAGRPGCDAVGELAAVWGAAAPGNTAFVGSRAGDGRWGVGALCRGPARFTSLWLPRPRWSPWQRAALFVESGPWLVGTLHLEVWPIGAPARRAQMRTVLDFLAAHDGARGRPVVLAGDLNCERGAPHTELVRAGFRPALLGPGTHLRLRRVAAAARSHLRARGGGGSGGRRHRRARLRPLARVGGGPDGCTGRQR